MEEEVVQKMEQLERTIDAKKTERTSLNTQKEEVEKALKELEAKCSDEFGIKPEQLESKIAELDTEVQEGLKELDRLLQGEN